MRPGVCAEYGYISCMAYPLILRSLLISSEMVVEERLAALRPKTQHPTAVFLPLFNSTDISLFARLGPS